MTMSTLPRFDYAAACAEVAAPVAAKLNADALAIYRALRDEPAYKDLRQGPSLAVPMPAELRPRFDAIGTPALALAAQALHFLGHWGGQLDPATRDTRGATWKFSNLADQVLRERLSLTDPGPRKMIGWHFEVHEGALRLCASTPDSWTWCDIGPATESFLDEARKWCGTLTGCPATRYKRSDPRWQAFEEAAWDNTRTAPEALAGMLPEAWRRFLSCGTDYMREPGKGSGDCPECGKQQLWNTGSLNHEIKCSRYPMEARADNALRHAEVFGLTEQQVAAARAAILAAAPTTEDHAR